MKVVVGGVISLSPYCPGFAWDWLQYAVGFQRLGHDVVYIEEVEPSWCVDAEGRPCDFERSINRVLFRSTMERFGFTGRAFQFFNRGGAISGLSREALRAACEDADVLFNISGHVKAEFVLDSVRRRAYVDQDPVYTQLWHAEYDKDLNFRAHDVFFTVGLNIGTPHTEIPDCGIQWHHALPPVVPDLWTVRFDPSCRRFTTIASLSAYSDLRFRGVWYQSKEVEFRRFADLPRRVTQEFEVALRDDRGAEETAGLLRDGGWLLTDASRIDDLDGYQEFIARSRAEIGIAKNAYVRSASGWFSDRAAHYLASGKPVLAQSTGFERCVPTGRGLLTFRDPDEAVDGVRRINRDYEVHCRAAREFAEHQLDYRKILPKMLQIATA